MNGNEVERRIRSLEQATDIPRGVPSEILANAEYAVDTAGSAAAAPVQFSTPAFTSKTGTVKVTAGIQVTGTGGTSVAGELVQFNILQGAATILEPTIEAELSATHIVAQATLTAVFQPGPGAHTYGVNASNATTPAHTLAIPANGAWVRVEDVYD
jgi:tellurite resistance-related uncharacterized protein